MDTVGGKMMVVRALVLELDLIVGDVSTDPLKNVDEEIHFAAMVPMQLAKILEVDSTLLEKVRQLILGGGPVSPTLISQIQEVPTQIYHTFGMTETVSHIALRKLNHRLESDFHCLPGIDIHERNGQLVVNAAMLNVHDLETHDAVTLTSPTSFQWLGRTDFVINSGGIKLHPEEIEAKLTTLLPYSFFICGEADELLGEKAVLIIEHFENLHLSKSDFTPFLDAYAIPKMVRYVPQFTYTASGKINRIISKTKENVAFEVL
jgi:o-succinylbenzoate---CoA ligase